MGKLSLALNPTFKATVMVPVPGAEPSPVVFTFRHKTRREMAAFLSARKGDDKEVDRGNLPELVDAAVKRDVEMVMDVAAAWDLDDEFNAESVTRMIDLYEDAAGAIIRTYAEENAGQKAKN